MYRKTSYYWEKLIDLLRPPVEGLGRTQAVPAGDTVDVSVSIAEDKQNANTQEMGSNVLGHRSYHTCIVL